MEKQTWDDNNESVDLFRRVRISSRVQKLNERVGIGVWSKSEEVCVLIISESKELPLFFQRCEMRTNRFNKKDVLKNNW